MNNFFKNPLLWFLLGALLAFLITRYWCCPQCPPVSVANTTWNRDECVIAPINDRTAIQLDASTPGGTGTGPSTTGTGDPFVSESMLFIQNYITHFQSCETKVTKGGSMPRCVLQNILNSLDSGQTHVEYRFGYDDVIQKTILIVQGGKHNPAPGGVNFDHPLMYRTGSDMRCFCPSVCNGWSDAN